MKREYKWLLLLMLGGAYFFHQADRAIFGVLTPYIQADLGLSEIEIGHITTVLFITIAVVTFFAGLIGDRYNRKWIITGSLIFWSCATVAIGFIEEFQILGFTVSCFAMTMILRSIAVGGGESFYAPSAMSLLAAYHKETRSLAFSIHQAVLYFGLMMSGVLAAKVLGFFGSWRSVFITFGVAGIVLGGILIFLLKEPERDTAVGEKPNLRLSEAFKAYFTNPSALLATSGFIAVVCVNNAYISWAPKIFSERFQVDVGVAGRDVMLYHHLVAFAAVLFGGFLTDKFVRTMPRFRLALQILALLCGAAALNFIGSSGAFATAVACTAIYGFFRGLFEVNTHASVFDVISSRHHASVVGFMLLLAMSLGALFAGEVIGTVLESLSQDEGCTAVFRLMAAVYLLAAVLMSISFFFTFKRDKLKKEEL